MQWWNAFRKNSKILITESIFAPTGDGTRHAGEIDGRWQTNGPNVGVHLDGLIKDQQGQVIAQGAAVVVAVDDDFLHVDVLIWRLAGFADVKFAQTHQKIFAFNPVH